MTISDRWTAGELEIIVQELTAELEKTSPALRTEKS
jgi:hypothetical protein